MNAKTFVTNSAYILGLSLILSLIVNALGLFPGDIITAPIRSNLTIILLAAMLTLSLSRIPMTNLSPLKNPKSIVRAIFLGLIISAIIPAIGYLLLKDGQYAVEASGLVFIAATPFAASVAPLSYVLRGDMEHALRSTIYVYLISLVWIPFIVWLLLGESVNMETVVITVIEIIGIPIILSRFLTKIEIKKDTMAIILNCVIFVLIFMSVASTVFPKELSILLIFMLIAAFRTFGLGNGVELIEKKLGVHWNQRVTDILITSYKNKGIAIALCVATLGPSAQFAMVAIATSIVIEICWVIYMDLVLFSKKRMERELASEGTDIN